MTVLMKKAGSTEANYRLIGDGTAMRALRDMIARIAPSSAPVMLQGPSGSGKEMAARAIHAASDRADKPFVAINCGAIPAELIESELFGHEKGSFTGAIARRIGRFEEADGGTLFLDEIGDMRFDMQVKLLRVLEAREISRIGGTGTIPVDVRIISATHQDLDQAIIDGRFREDLYFRLSVLPLTIPSLQERCDDIPALLRHFHVSAARDSKLEFAPSAMAMLKSHDWPGNIRELRNVFERANALFPGEVIDEHKASILLGRKDAVIAPAPMLAKPLSVPSDSGAPIDLRQLIESVELDRIRMALERADGVIAEAARLLTLKRTTLIEKMRRHGLQGG
jgi:sigma-54 dependent transcriptional regulator, flagellar regulatory protein